MMPRLATAQETRNAFVWLEFEVPPNLSVPGWTLNAVTGLNNEGRILGQVIKSGAGTRGFVITNDEWVTLTPDASTSVRDMNNSGKVVGWTVNPITGRGWVPEYTTDGTDIGSNIQVEGINDSDDYVGYDTNQQTPVGFLDTTQGWTALPPLIGGDATAAYGISNGDQSNYPFIVGQSIGGLPYEDRPVLWTYDGQDFLAHSLDPSNADPDDVPYFVNNNGWIVGSTDYGSPFEYLVWMPDGNGGWTRNDIGLSGTARGIGLNAENELVAGHYLFVDDGNGGVDQYDLFDMAAIPVQGEADRYYVPASTNFRAINDNGWIVGKATRKESGQSDVQVVILLVPYDMDNNETPDYREIITETPYVVDTNDNWVLDQSEQMRRGLHAPGADSISSQIQYAQIIRRMKTHDYVRKMMFEEEEYCQNEIIQTVQWGQNEDYPSTDPFSDRPKEIIFTVRTQNPYDTSETTDYVPPITGSQGEYSQAETLEALQCFGYHFSRYIDYVQLGNEILNGSGRFYILDGQLPNYSGGLLTEVPGDLYNDALELIFDWLGQEVQAVRRGSALAGRPLRIIGPATGWQSILRGEQGDADGPYDVGEDPEDSPNFNRIARFVQRLIQFCNENNIPVDSHYNYWDYEGQFLPAVDSLANQGNVDWDVPEGMVCLEISPTPSRNVQGQTGHWWTSTHADDTELFYDSDPETLPEGIDDWSEWLDFWMIDDAKWDPPSDFIEDSFDTLESYGYLVACYPTRQITGDQTEATPFDFSPMYTDKVRPYEDRMTTLWLTHFQDAADGHLVSPWNPHSNAWSLEPCPPCGN